MEKGNKIGELLTEAGQILVILNVLKISEIGSSKALEVYRNIASEISIF